MAKLNGQIITRLETERNIWIATVRHQPTRPIPIRPHLVPVWFVWHAEKLYICIESKSVKGYNLIQNPSVALSLEDGSSVVICEGTADPLPKPWPEAVQKLFAQKYDWEIAADKQYDWLVEISPQKWLVW